MEGVMADIRDLPREGRLLSNTRALPSVSRISLRRANVAALTFAVCVPAWPVTR